MKKYTIDVTLLDLAWLTLWYILIDFVLAYPAKLFWTWVFSLGSN